jgi:hypothetical protein
MASCAKPVDGVKGTAHGPAGTIKEIATLFGRAIAHLRLRGIEQCTGSCDSGNCTFGLTDLHADQTEIVPDADGQGATVTVTGDGTCFCS